MANGPDTVNPAPFPAPSSARNPHAGHRSRMRSKALTYGLDHLDDHEVLEMLLYHAIPRGDTNETAHRLLERFGSFRGLLEAPPEELQAVPGVGESAAVLLKLTMEAARRYYAARRTRRLHLTSTEAIGRFLTPVFIGRREENVYLLCLDAKKTPVYGRIITVSTRTAVSRHAPSRRNTSCWHTITRAAMPCRRSPTCRRRCSSSMRWPA